MKEKYQARLDKKTEKWRKYFEKQKRVHKQINDVASDILHSPNFKSTRQYIQHGNMTVNSHSMNVARCSLFISQALHIPCNKRDLIRGALLHDYFLYDWHDKDYVHPHRLHGFYHPGRALANASREYHLTNRQKDIIKKHMWPLTVVPPTCREAWIVTTADKWCSLMETFHFHKGHGKLIPKLREMSARENS